jgi:hypothetical protein
MRLPDPDDDFRQFFGRSRRRVLQELAAAVGGEYYEGRWNTVPYVRVSEEGWEVTVCFYTGPAVCSTTLLTARYVAHDRFRFRIQRAYLLSGIETLLGRQDVTVGDPEIDRCFLIQTNDVDQVRRLLENPRLRQLLLAEPSTHVIYAAAFDETLEADTLRCQTNGYVKDISRLKEFLAVISEMLRQLRVIGSALPADARPSQLSS